MKKNRGRSHRFPLSISRLDLDLVTSQTPLNTRKTAIAWVGLRMPMPMRIEAVTETMGCT